nr:putative thiazole-containing bacteriocin maturation protein [Alicyclobacillus macrosporangiidus]
MLVRLARRARTARRRRQDVVKLHPSMRLKVKGDTFFVPDESGGVYFRNNEGSFRMEGRSIVEWINHLMPVFDGTHTLGELTEGLNDAHRNRVYEIAQVLYENGFLRDVASDPPHSLRDELITNYASQIEFLDHLFGAGAYRFELYRKARVLAVGAGPFLASLVSALLESGLPGIHVLVTEEVPTHRDRIAELVRHAQRSDPDVDFQEVGMPGTGQDVLRAIVRPFDAVLYVSQTGRLEDLQTFEAACRDEGKRFLPAICAGQAGLVGPFTCPGRPDSWASAWRRMHQAAMAKDEKVHAFSSTAGAMMANVLVLEWFKWVAGERAAEEEPRFFLLNFETLEGHWHSFWPHPLVVGTTPPVPVADLERKLGAADEPSDSQGLLPFFARLTSPITGIFHIWEEGDLVQLPLAQCRVQVADPLSPGPARLLPEIVCAGLTHEEARREAGLVGVETYVSRLIGDPGVSLSPRRPGEHPDGGPPLYTGIGAGETLAEGVSRALVRCLEEALRHREHDAPPSVSQIVLTEVADIHCRCYLEALAVLGGEPEFGLGVPVLGCPVVWVRSGKRWFAGVGLNVTLALRAALTHALLSLQHLVTYGSGRGLETEFVQLSEGSPQSLSVPASPDGTQAQVVRAALQRLQGTGMRVDVVDVSPEPWVKESLAGVFAVALRKEMST